jgi:hypothetical protein
MRTFRFIVLCVLSFGIVLTSRPLLAQRATGGVNGTETDPTGSVFVDANVTLTNPHSWRNRKRVAQLQHFLLSRPEGWPTHQR